jgi:hypothetical protein
MDERREDPAREESASIRGDDRNLTDLADEVHRVGHGDV